MGTNHFERSDLTPNPDCRCRTQPKKPLTNTASMLHWNSEQKPPDLKPRWRRSLELREKKHKGKELKRSRNVFTSRPKVVVACENVFTFCFCFASYGFFISIWKFHMVLKQHLFRNWIGQLFILWTNNFETCSTWLSDVFNDFKWTIFITKSKFYYYSTYYPNFYSIFQEVYFFYNRGDFKSFLGSKTNITKPCIRYVTSPSKWYG